MNIMHLYQYLWLLFETELYPGFGEECRIIRCPKCRFTMKYDEWFSMWQERYQCINPDCKHIVPVPYKPEDLIKLADESLNARNLKDADIINLDGILVPILKDKVPNAHWYRAECKVSEWKWWKIQLMVLAWCKSDKTKTQLFITPEDSRMTFDQNDSHPSKVFVKITAEFKNSTTSIETNE